MKAKLIILILSIIFAIGALSVQFGAWEDNLQANIDVKMVKSFNTNGEEFSGELESEETTGLGLTNLNREQVSNLGEGNETYLNVEGQDGKPDVESGAEKGTGIWPKGRDEEQKEQDEEQKQQDEKQKEQEIEAEDTDMDITNQQETDKVTDKQDETGIGVEKELEENKGKEQQIEIDVEIEKQEEKSDTETDEAGESNTEKKQAKDCKKSNDN